jgi:hypothetical protein
MATIRAAAARRSAAAKPWALDYMGSSSHGRYCHLDAPHYISLVFLHTKYTKRRLNDRLAHG